MKFTDKSIRCSMCGTDFKFTAGEQQYYAENKWENEPSRCHICRRIKKPERSSSNGNSDRYSGLGLH